MTKGDKEMYRVEAAIAAMSAMISSDLIMEAFDRRAKDGSTERRDEAFSKNAVLFADALMAELGIKGED